MAKRSWLMAILPSVFLLSGSVLALPAYALDAANLVREGNGRDAPGCVACHGERGEGNRDAGYPRLAGLSAIYLAHQLDSFRAGSRINEIMGPIAAALNPDEIKAVSDYYGELAAPTTSAPAGDQQKAAQGKILAEIGDWPRGIPGCGQCHGTTGLGVGTVFPAIAGQPEAYLVSQLTAWKDGARRNDPLGLMAGLVRKLDPDKIAAVSAYYASLPASRPRDGGAR